MLRSLELVKESSSQPNFNVNPSYLQNPYPTEFEHAFWGHYKPRAQPGPTLGDASGRLLLNLPIGFLRLEMKFGIECGGSQYPSGLER